MLACDFAPRSTFNSRTLSIFHSSAQLIINDETKKELTSHEAWDDFLQHLHNIGIAVFEPTSTIICLNVEILSRMMSAFVAPDHHIGRLFESSEEKHFKSDIVPVEVCHSPLFRFEILN